MKKDDAKGFVSLNGEQIKRIRGGQMNAGIDPTGPVKLRVDMCLPPDPPPSSTDNLCGSCPYHRMG